jgi:hypothetical protein
MWQWRHLPQTGLQPQSAVAEHDGAPQEGAAHDGVGAVQVGTAQPQETALVQEFVSQQPWPKMRDKHGWQWPLVLQPVSHVLQPQWRFNRWCVWQRLKFWTYPAHKCPMQAGGQSHVPGP